jgi:LysM repeat protein
MRKNLFTVIIFFIAILLTLATISCQRTASKEAVITPTLMDELPFPVATQPPVMLDILDSTQTAMAGQSGEVQETSITDQSGEVQETLTTAEPTEEPEPTATSTPIVFPTSTPGRPETYIIQQGEFLYCIARRFNVNPADLISLNSINENTILDPGTELIIPSSGTWELGPRNLKEHPTQYTVLAGDTIYKIACDFGDVSPNEIMDANQIESAETLIVGQVLQIP